MESMVRILGAFVDTLVLNVYPTDQAFEVEERRVDPLLQEELMLLKEQAQELEEDFSPGGKHEKTLKKIDAEIDSGNFTPLP